MPELLLLFLTFLKIGAVSFGGGYGMIPIIKDEVLANNWLTEEQLLNFIAVSESTPGPIAINMATFIGASQGGILGAMLATLGVVLPAFCIILIIATIIKGLLQFAGVKAFLGGIRPVVIGLIVGTGLLMALSVIIGLSSVSMPISFDWKALVIFLLIFTLWFFAKWLNKKFNKKYLSMLSSPIALIIFSALLGMLFYGLIG